VDHLPASASVPTPLKVLGYVPGTVGRLSKTADVNRYFRAVAAASPRVKVFSLGRSEEGREMLVAAVASEATLARLDEYRGMAGRLADPRGLSEAERGRIAQQAKPIYWLTGSIHSPETGSPEMLMELVYRLAVEETPRIRGIRDSAITLITPLVETDGRDRMVDVIAQQRALGLGQNGMPLVYWGKYVAHDNNRDGLVLSLKLSQNVNAGGLYWHPTVLHDLHESVPFLYASTGTGPYNEQFDPIVVNEWHQLAYQEINELTRRGLPGVWTHGFYDGWAPNYMFGIAQFHNAIGRFYETYTSAGGDCHVVNLPASSTSREWDRTNPAVNGVKWCIRSNINYQQSGVLVALDYVARNRQTFVDNFALKARRSVERGQRQAPYAFVIPRAQRRSAEAADLVNYFRRTGSEVHEATAEFAVRTMPAVVERGPSPSGAAGGAAAGGARPDSARRDSARAAGAPAANTVTVRPGDWVVRLDQPYAAFPRTVLAVQRFKADDPAPYDDTGWTLDALRHVETYPIADSSVLARPMTRLTADAAVGGTVAGAGGTLLVPHLGDWRSAVFPWKAGAGVRVAERAFTVGDRSFPAGTYLVRDADGRAARAVRELGLQATSVAEVPEVAAHAVSLPRIALVHSWLETQNEGWVRFTFDKLGIPYTSMADQTLGRAGRLDRVDVVVYPHVGATTGTLLQGRPMLGPAIPWKRTAATPHLGRWDETDDVRPGLGLEGAAALRRFVERGGLLVVEGATARMPVELGLTPTLSAPAAPRLQARGGVYRAQIVEGTHPVLYGYERATFPLFFSLGSAAVASPLFTVSPRDSTRDEMTGSAVTAEAERARARVLVRWHERADSLLVSGMLAAGDEMAGKGAVVDAPLGRGHVLLFGTRPFWRWQTQGAFALALNGIAHWNHLAPAAAPRAAPPTVGAR
jgi:hypothetical protein